jgi:acetyl esterase/lipase
MSETALPRRNRFWRVIKWTGAIALVFAAAAGIWVWSRQAPPPDFAELRYGSASQAQALDVYLPEGKGPFPVVVYLHGGAFMFGDKRDQFGDFKGNILAMKAAGIALASVNYRMSGEAKFPAAVQDVKSAVRFLRANAVRFKIDPVRIAVWGKSAGGHLALMASVAQGEPEFDDRDALIKNVDDRVSGVISMYGPTDFMQMDLQLAANGCPQGDLTHNNDDSPESLYLGQTITQIPAVAARSNPITYLTSASPPMLLMHGSKDCTVPPLQSQIMFDAANAILPKGKTQLSIIEGAGHGDSVFDDRVQMNTVIAFLMQAFSKPLLDQKVTKP